jgi:hypothetical protein
MIEFLKHVAELVFAHVVAGAILGTLGVWVALKLWKPARNFWAVRKWFDRVMKVGVRNFYPSRESYARDRSLPFGDYLNSSRRSLRYIGHWLAFTIEQHQMLDTLCAISNSGRKVQLILLDPGLPSDVLAAYARYLGEDETGLLRDITTTWNKVREARDTLSAKGRACLELKRHIEFIPYSAFWFDRDTDGQHILIDMKLYGASRKDAYGLEIEPTKEGSTAYPSLFDRYARSLALLEQRSILVT